MSDKLDILLEAYKSWGRNPQNIGIWLYNKILEESGSDQLPELQIGEIVFYFCDQCGMDFLAKPLKCQCGGSEFHKLGTQQGLAWRNRKFGNQSKYKTVRPPYIDMEHSLDPELELVDRVLSRKS